MHYTKTICHNCGEKYTKANRPLCTYCFEQTFNHVKIIDECFNVELENDNFYFIFQNEKIVLDIIKYPYEPKDENLKKIKILFEIYKNCKLTFAYFSFYNTSNEIETVLTLKINFIEDAQEYGGMFTIKSKLQKNKIITYIKEKYGENLITIKKN